VRTLCKSNADLLHGSVFLAAFIACLTVLPRSAYSQALSATGSVITSFSAGVDPISSLIQASDGNLYGVTNSGGEYGCGSIYQLTSAGNLTTLYSFTGGTDGGYPAAGVVEAPDGALYGTTTLGGAMGLGTVFRFSGNSFATLHSFDPDADGNSPYSALTLASDGNLYGLLAEGAYDYSTQNYAGGTIFQVTPQGSYQNIYSFPEDQSAGNLPVGRLLQASDGNLWGSTSAGGTNGSGTLFLWNPQQGLTVVHQFAESEGEPLYGLAQNGPSVYGVTYPALNGYGEVFSVTVATHAFAAVYTFTGANDGGAPATSLLPYSDGSLYGTTQEGGNSGTGTLFRLNSSGQPITLYSFPSGSLNTFADASLIESSTGALYLPLLYDSTVGLDDSQMDGAGNVLQLQPNATPSAPAPVQLSASASSIAAGQSVSLTWSLSNAASLTSQQCYAFSSPAISWTGHQSPNGSANVVLATAGRYTFSLSCGGNQSNSVTVAVTALAPTTTILSAPASVTLGQTASLVATVTSPASAPSGRVNFVVNGSLNLASVLLNDGAASFTASTTGIPTGTYTVQAVYGGDSTHSSSSSAVSHVIVAQAASTTITLAASPQSVTSGQPVTLAASVSSAAGTPSGTVAFLYGTLQLGTAALHGGTASLTASSTGIAAGTYGVHAVYAGSSSFQSSSSGTVTVAVR
jgi:uncharacterized repeat protein (TIGR03803 family)